MAERTFVFGNSIKTGKPNKTQKKNKQNSPIGATLQYAGALFLPLSLCLSMPDCCCCSACSHCFVVVGADNCTGIVGITTARHLFFFYGRSWLSVVAFVFIFLFVAADNANTRCVPFARSALRLSVYRPYAAL